MDLYWIERATGIMNALEDLTTAGGLILVAEALESSAEDHKDHLLLISIAETRRLEEYRELFNAVELFDIPLEEYASKAQLEFLKTPEGLGYMATFMPTRDLAAEKADYLRIIGRQSEASRKYTAGKLAIKSEGD